ncbi:MAG: carbonic anhydrase family protein [Bdellovibrionales bacterium]|nr:carbonic anhydrase family protein [Bdellovibrionales bacterium]
MPKAVEAAPPQETQPEPPQDHSHIQTSHEAHWSYEGETGPENWGDLKPEYSLCKTGQNQSPIDLVFKKPQTGRDIKTSFKNSAVKIIDNGHTIQVNFEPGNSIEIEGEKFNLLQAHFHSSSEHAIAGNLLPMEMHLVHKSDAGDLAVLGVILIEGASHPILESIWQSIPIQKGMEKEVSFTINPEDLIPRTRTYYNYSGSLTTPPCSEGVNWNVFNTPVTISTEQIMAFRSLYPSNNRPLQPLGNRRTVNYR